MTTREQKETKMKRRWIIYMIQNISCYLLGPNFSAVSSEISAIVALVLLFCVEPIHLFIYYFFFFQLSAAVWLS